VETFEDVQNVISRSSIHAKVQPLRDFSNNQTLVQIFDFKTFLEQYFKKSSTEQKRFTNQFYKFISSSPCFETRKYFNSESQKINLFKKNLILLNESLNPASIISEIKVLPIEDNEDSRKIDLKKLEKFIDVSKLYKFWLAMKGSQSN